MNCKEPAHIQLREIIRQKIEEGEYKTGEAIPSERKMTELYGVNRMIVKSAINSLAKEGLLYKMHGKGTFVIRNKAISNLEKLTGLGASLKGIGIQPSSKLILKESFDDNKYINSKLNIDPGKEVYRLLRLRLGNNEPLALEDTYLPMELFPDINSINFEEISLYEYMETKNIKIDNSYQTLTLAKANEKEAKLLHIPRDTEIFLFEYLSRDKAGRVVEYTKSYTRGDKITYEVMSK